MPLTTKEQRPALYTMCYWYIQSIYPTKLITKYYSLVIHVHKTILCVVLPVMASCYMHVSLKALWNCSHQSQAHMFPSLVFLEKGTVHSSEETSEHQYWLQRMGLLNVAQIPLHQLE